MLSLQNYPEYEELELELTFPPLVKLSKLAFPLTEAVSELQQSRPAPVS
jgi:hypothetical protein